MAMIRCHNFLSAGTDILICTRVRVMPPHWWSNRYADLCGWVNFTFGPLGM